jgi:hypothetical protein
MSLLKCLLIALVILFSVSIATAGDILLEWDAPTTNEDGTVLTDLAGYKLYYGSAPGIYDQNIDLGNITNTSQSLPPGMYYFAVTAYDTSGNESKYSDEVSIDALAPNKVKLRIVIE